MSITPNALYYHEQGWLEHKILLGGERKHEDSDEQRDKTAAVRQMLSHGYISKATVVEGLKGREIRQDGPVSYSETTTKDSIFQEDANRCLQINTSADVELTRRILRAQSANYMPGQDNGQERKENIRRQHHIFQQMLQCVDVRIPYAKILADKVPTGQIEIRRIFGQMLSLIDVIAWLHQFQRVPNEYGQLEATLDDYRLARRLALGSLHLAIGLGKDYEKCKMIEKKLPEGKPFTTTEAAQALGDKSRKVTLDALAQLEDAGVIHCFVKGQGNRPTRWNWTGVSVDELILPSVETVEAALQV
jgi:hypothetical protein